MQTLQQQRAQFALEAVKAIAATDLEDFKRQAESFPAMIRMNGLGQAAAFYYSKREKEKNGQKKINAHERLYQLLSNWLARQDQPYHGCKDLLAGITQQDQHHYRLAQAEALLLLDWVKRFAKAFAGDEDQTNPPGESS